MNTIEKNKKIYFASDLHLGVPDAKQSRERESIFINWLNSIEKEATAIYIIGDIFDFWHEYETVVPKGFVRLLGKLAALSDAGIEIHIFTGNHDLWMSDYLEKEVGAKIHFKPIEVTIQQKLFLIGHGDGLGPGDKGYKWMKKIFTNPICKWLFKWLHPDIGTRLGNYFSFKSRYGHGGIAPEVFLGEDKEWLILYAKRKLAAKHFDYFVFGHRHLPITFNLTENSKYINTGDWITYFSYAEFDGIDLVLKYYK